MVFKRYITRDGKKYGPYYYRTLRDPKTGKVRNIYIGKEAPQERPAKPERVPAQDESAPDAPPGRSTSRQPNARLIPGLLVFALALAFGLGIYGGITGLVTVQAEPGTAIIAWDSGPGASALFDGARGYAFISGSDDLAFAGNRLTVEVTARIDPDSKGVLISKRDYLQGKVLGIGVNYEGTIWFEAGDGDSSITVETARRYNDGAEHTVLAELDGRTARISVDGVLEAEMDASALGDVNSAAPFSVGADASQRAWTNTTSYNYKGSIKHVRISTR